MSVGAQPETVGPPAAGATSGGQAAGRPDTAGRLLGQLSVLPALLVMSWLLAGFPLLLIGHFTPVLTLVVSVPLAVVLVPLGLRWIPGPSPGAWPARHPEQGKERTPWWAVAAVVAVAIAFGIDQVIYHSQFIIVMRDPASYFQFAEWISRHGSLPIPQDRAAFGGAHSSIFDFSSFAYYQVGNSVVPQFMAGLPMVLAGAMWIGGANAALVAAPVLGAAALLTFGGLTARLAGPRWAPLAVLALALSMPEQFTSRSNYSEPLAQILFLGGLCLVIDSLNRNQAAGDRVGGDRVIAAIGGPRARPDRAGAHRRGQRHPADGPVLRPAASRPAAAGPAADRRRGGRRGLRPHRRAGVFPAVPGRPTSRRSCCSRWRAPLCSSRRWRRCRCCGTVACRR